MRPSGDSHPMRQGSFLSLFLSLVIASIGWGRSSTPGEATADASPTGISDLPKRVKAGDSSAEYSLGRVYETGNGVRRDPEQAAAWYLEAAGQGDARAQNSLGALYWVGEA